MITIYLIYAVFNTYMDVKYRITKNYWHLLFIIVGTLISLVGYSVEILDLLILIFLSLFIGVILETFKFSSSGDTKMLIVTSIYLSHFLEMSSSEIVLGLIGFYILYLVVGALVSLILTKRLLKSIKQLVKDFFWLIIYRIKPIQEEAILSTFPGAILVLLSFLSMYFMSV